MKNIKRGLFIIVSLLFIFSSFSLGMAVVGIQSVWPTALTTYNRFLAADLGLLPGGKDNKVFSITFNADASVTAHYLHIEVSDGSKVLLSGNTALTGKQYDTEFSGRILYNYDILDELGGKFSIASGAGKVKHKIMATGVLPEGTYTITIQLYQSGGVYVDEETINFIIIPPYLQPVYPVDTSVTKAALNFKWLTNITNKELHIFTDPRGNNEILAGNRLPIRNVSRSYRGSGLGSLLTDATSYYWQIYGHISTTHGDELVKGPLSAFLYFEDASYVIDLGLSDKDKEQIMDELIIILEELINKRAAKSISTYDIDRIVLDNSVVTREEIMAILLAIKSKQLNVNSVYFK